MKLEERALLESKEAQLSPLLQVVSDLFISRLGF
jgi:hypothetical protein